MTTSSNKIDVENPARENELEALASLPSSHHPVASPAGDRIAFYYDGTGQNEVYIRDITSGERTQVSDGNVPKDVKNPIVWDADGERLFLHCDEKGNEQYDIHAIERTGEKEPIVETEGQTRLWDISTDGSVLLYSTTATGQVNLHTYHVESGTSTQLTEYDQPARYGRISPEGEYIAFQTNERGRVSNRDAYIMSVDGSDKRRLDVGNDSSESLVQSWTPSGDAVLVGDDSANRNRCGVYDLTTDEITWYGGGEYVERPQYVLPDGTGFLAIRSRDCSRVPVYYDRDDPQTGHELALSDGAAVLPNGPHWNGVMADGRILVAQSTTARRETLYAYDLESDEYETILDAEYGEFDPTEFISGEVVTYESSDGLEIEGLLYDSGVRPSPAVVVVHGGPHVAATKRFDSRAQFLVRRGYTVFKPNYRGSTGRGRKFKNRIHGDWGGMEQEDIAAAGRWLKNRDWVDDDRVAVFGTSYGGYSTYMQLVKYPTLWATGVAHVGMTDLKRLYEDSMPQFQTGLEMQVGDPEADADHYRDRSPISHVENMERPIFIVHGTNDPRCPVSQARLFKEKLEEYGWEEGTEFEYCELEGEGHGSRDINHKIRTYRLMADYFEERL